MRRLAFSTICAIAVLMGIARVDSAGARPMNTVVTGCTKASVGNFCITVTKGRKNRARHRQWVVSIHLWSVGTLCPNGWEAWTQNWYMAPAGTGCYPDSLSYAINRWVRTNNYVCGRGYYNTTNVTACIAIRV
jgi:hypothetical protein